MEGIPSRWLRPALEARTRFFDDQVLIAIAAGIGQVVVLGAGYDDRALRFRSPGVRFFEIDHSATQDDKIRRLRTTGMDTGGPVTAAADFRSDQVGVVLAGCGHAEGSPSLFICEGLLVYLDQPTIVDLLSSLRSRAAPRSRLAASLATHPQGLDSHQVTVVANGRRRSAGSEPWLTILPAELHLGLVARAGWVLDRSIDAAQVDGDVAPGRSLLITAHPSRARSHRGR
jgi:methyltransferase (TIGR00027 family)